MTVFSSVITHSEFAVNKTHVVVKILIFLFLLMENRPLKNVVVIFERAKIVFLTDLPSHSVIKIYSS